MKYLKYLVSIITAISISSVVSANEIKMAKADWDTGYFPSRDLQTSLEKMGYKVTEPKANEATGFLRCGSCWRFRLMGEWLVWDS